MRSELYDISHQGIQVMNRKVTTASKQLTGKRSPSANRDRPTVRPYKNLPLGISFPHPLSWWRTRRAQQFRKVDVAIARNFLERSAIIGEPHWHLGAGGDAAVAIGVALRIRRRQGEKLVLVDVAMTAVLCCALDGDVTAAVLLSTILQERAAIEPACAELSDSWLSSKPAKSPRLSNSSGLAEGANVIGISKDWREEFIKAHPTLFLPLPAPGGYPECGEGWQQILEVACGRMEAALANGESVRIEQIKEKYGTLRIDWSGTVTDTARSEIEEAVALATARSACTCAICGNQGRLHSRGGRLATACTDHAKGYPVPIRAELENLYIARPPGLAGQASVVSCRRYIRSSDIFVDVDPRLVGIER